MGSLELTLPDLLPASRTRGFGDWRSQQGPFQRYFQTNLHRGCFHRTADQRAGAFQTTPSTVIRSQTTYRSIHFPTASPVLISCRRLRCSSLDSLSLFLCPSDYQTSGCELSSCWLCRVKRASLWFSRTTRLNQSRSLQASTLCASFRATSSGKSRHSCEKSFALICPALFIVLVKDGCPRRPLRMLSLRQHAYRPRQPSSIPTALMFSPKAWIRPALPKALC